MHRPGDRLDAVLGPELVHRRGQVQGNRRQRAVELVGDLPCRQAFGGPAQALDFAAGQTDGAGRGLLGQQGIGRLLQSVGNLTEIAQVLPGVVQVALAGLGAQAGQGRQPAPWQVDRHSHAAGQLRIVQVADHRGVATVDVALQDGLALGQVRPDEGRDGGHGNLLYRVDLVETLGTPQVLPVLRGLAQSDHARGDQLADMIQRHRAVVVHEGIKAQFCRQFGDAVHLFVQALVRRQTGIEFSHLGLHT
ncbi:hypothetical protein WR25_25887 [Diploscapter pachys]|uniref:Uncharacterized protein n=1 Tax=Diploscapter pachys TaxID=2018661 RepID=A0A2A2K5W6_9BILA|nr:hypothetical protein WR25_25887 [Diploscapter pachys]